MKQEDLLQRAIVSIGSNAGDSRRTVLEAMERLQSFSCEPILRSSLWQTSPVLCPPGSADFLNAVAVVRPADSETPESFLEKLQKMERSYGRSPKKVLNEARPLDLDLITFRDEQRSTPALTLPHPRAHLRKFVLAPLSELLPATVLPGWKEPVSILLAQLVSDEEIRRLD